MLNRLFIILLLCFTGCVAEIEKPAEIDSGLDNQMINTYFTNKTCLSCGEVMKVQSRNKLQNREVEWCFHCGRFCQEGLDIYIKVAEEAQRLIDNDLETSEKMVEVEMEMISHCKECLGCKAALFTPEKWAAAMKELENEG